MERAEMLQVMEEVLDTKLNEDAFGPVIEEKLEKYLLPVKRADVLIGEQVQEKEPEKVTFSQFLGDVRRAAGGARLGEKLKFMDPEQLIKADTGINPERVPAEIRKDLYEGTAASGGYLVPTEESRQLIDTATERFSVVPGLCRSVPMRTHQITFPTLTSGLTAYWIPEATSTLGSSVDGTGQSSGEKIQSDITLGQMTITAFVCAVKVVVSNQLLDDSDPAIDAILRVLFAETLGDAWDDACLTGAGSATDPITGLDSLITTNVLAAGAVFNFDDIVDLIFGSLEQDSKCYPHIIGHTKAEKVIMKVKDNDGQYIYKKPREAAGVPDVWGHPYHRDGNVSITLGSGADTKLYGGDFGRHGFAGRRLGLTVATNPFGEPYFSFNQTAFRAEFRVGFTVDAEKYFSSLSGVPTS